MFATRGRLVLDFSAEVYVSRAFSRPGVQIAALTPEIAVRSSRLPGTLHGDPADRMLVATAMLMGLKLMTRDRRILDYAAQGHLSACPADAGCRCEPVLTQVHRRNRLSTSDLALHH